MKYLLKRTNIAVEVDSCGAEMTSVIYKGVERLWQNDNGSWKRHAPILFPHAGNCLINVDGKEYPHEFHGFARDMEFELLSKTNDSVCLLLKSNEVTHKTYPYDFELYVYYEINDNEVKVSYKVLNPSNDDIYFFLGCHESYALDSDVSNFYVQFDKDDNLESWDESMTKTFKVGANKVIDLSIDALKDAGSVVLENINSTRVYLKRKSDNSLVAATSFEGFHNFLLWHPTGSNMICLEPWMNLPDKPDNKNNELKDKKYVVKVEPGNIREFIRTIAYF